MIEVPKRAFDARVMMHSIRLLHSLGGRLARSESLLRFEIGLTRDVGLFDRDFYLGQVDPAELGQMSALRHYVMHGDAAGLWPSPMFDVRHYDQQCPGRPPVNRLLHYGLVARHQGLSPTPWFDADYYLRSNPDVAAAGLDPLAHFQRWGWREGRNPLPGLDIRRLLHSLPELKVVKSHALGVFATDAVARHLDDASRREPSPRPPVVPPGAAAAEPVTDWLRPEHWAALAPRAAAGAPLVDVVIPVYGGLQETLACLHSVLSAPVCTPHEVVVIDDASPLPELAAMLRVLAGRGLITLETNRANQGFVRSVNKGMRQHRERDVVLLNSDTEVYGDWLDRLLAHARAHPRLATLTPLSNNATICSYPATLGDNRLPLELPHAEIDRLAADANRGQHVLLPTGVGFCMFVRRAALRDVGLFDDRRFGRGYGEENDFCQRARQRGWRHAQACDVYVRHVGSVSFRAEAAERVAQALKTLGKLYPDYEQQVTQHIAADPGWVHRARLDLARLRRLTSSRNVLLVSHHRGGGTERHLLEQSQQLMAAGATVFELRPSPMAGRVALQHAGLFGLQNLATLPLDEGGLLDEALRALRIGEIHVHHLIDFPAETGERLRAAAQGLGLVLRVVVHDFYAVCPRVNLVDAGGRFCGLPKAHDCDACLAQDGLQQSAGDIAGWRARSRRLFEAAEEVVVPSADTARRLKVLALGKPIAVRPHEIDPPPRIPAAPLVPLDQRVRVLVIGALSRIKGYDVVHRLGAVARAQGLPLDVALLGYSADDARLAAEGVRLLGRYFDAELQERIRAADPHLILLPSIWPETYCYALSGALHSGRRLAVFDLGAQAERVRQHDTQHLCLPLALAERPQALAETLLASARAPGLAAGGARQPARARPADA